MTIANIDPTATSVWLERLPGVTALPDMPAATSVWLYDLPGVTALPDMPAAIDVWLDNLPGVTADQAKKAAPNAKIYINGHPV